MQESWLNKISFLLPHTFPILLIFGYFMESPYLFIGLFFVYFGLLTSIDFILPRDLKKDYFLISELLANEGIGILNWYRLMIYLFIALYFVLLFTGIGYASHKLPVSGWLLYAIPVGFVSAIILTLCHELMHSKYKGEKILARIVASFSFWGLHEFEHLFFHHNNDVICTESDKSYAKLNQSVYSFLLQAYLGNYQHAWQIQKQISKRNNQSFYNPFTNLLLQIYLCSLVILLVTFLVAGIYGTLFLLIQGILGFTLFLAGTYNQHYGLTRRKLSDDSYEPFTFMNVWSSDFYVTSRLSFNVTHHAHHHKFQFCHYEFLEIIKEGPVLPYNYNVMIFMSFIPFLWYKIMNKRVEKVFQHRDELAKKGMIM